MGMLYQMAEESGVVWVSVTVRVTCPGGVRLLGSSESVRLGDGGEALNVTVSVKPPRDWISSI